MLLNTIAMKLHRGKKIYDGKAISKCEMSVCNSTRQLTACQFIGYLGTTAVNRSRSWTVAVVEAVLTQLQE